MKLFGLVWAGAAAFIAAARHRQRTAGRRRWRQALLSLPLHRIAEAPDGVAMRIRGGLRPSSGEPLIAPLSRRPCVAWHIRVEQRTRDLSNEPYWREVGERRRSRSVILEDGSGQAAMGEVTEWDLSFDARGGAGLWHLPESREMRRLLVDMGVSTERQGWERDVRIYEAACGIGEPVVVAGRGGWEIDTSQGASGYREIGHRLRLGPMNMGRLVVTDDRKVLRRSRG